MTLAALGATALGAGLGAQMAVADVVPTPTVPTVTVPPLPTNPLPTAPLPTTPAPTIPTPTTPTLPGTPSVPSPPVTSPGSPAPSAPSAGGAGSPSSPGGGSAQPSGSTAPGSHSAASGGVRQQSVTRLQLSRPWVTRHGRKGHGRTTLTFRLPRAGHVVFTVTQVSPACRVEGTFAVRGRRGVNRVAFTGRLGGRTLPVGTYRISARAPHSGAILLATLVIVDSGTPSRAELEAALHRNVCTSGAARAASRMLGVAASSEQSQSTRPNGLQQLAGSGQPSGGVAGASQTQASGYTATGSTSRVRNPLVIAALAAAVLLLGTAALPHGLIPSPRLNLAVMQHRAEIAAAGIAAFAAAIVALLFS